MQIEASRSQRGGPSELEEQVRVGRSLPPRAMRKAIRLAAGVTQKALADEVGVTRMTVYRWERGDREPKGALRAAYARVLGQLEEALR